MKPIVFFDGGCPLCRSEIQHYQRVDSAQRIQWIDIVKHPEHLKTHNLQLREAMEIIHGVDESGQVVSGATVFVLLWRQLPYYRFLAVFVTGLKLTPTADWFYRRFASWRFQRRLRSGCPLT